MSVTHKNFKLSEREWLEIASVKGQESPPGYQAVAPLLGDPMEFCGPLSQPVWTIIVKS